MAQICKCILMKLIYLDLEAFSLTGPFGHQSSLLGWSHYYPVSHHHHHHEHQHEHHE